MIVSAFQKAFLQKRTLLPTLLLTCLWSLAHFIASYQGEGFRQWFAGWEQWDVHWYKALYEHGYGGERDHLLVYPVGYAYLIGVPASVFGMSMTVLAPMVNVLCFWGGLLLYLRFLRRWGIDGVFLPTLCWLSSVPAFFAFALYSIPFLFFFSGD